MSICHKLGTRKSSDYPKGIKNIACKQALRLRMGEKKVAGEKGVGKGKKALLGSLHSPIPLGACSQAIKPMASQTPVGRANPWPTREPW